MPHQKLCEPKFRTWRQIRAEAVKAGRLNEEALEEHKRRMIAAERLARAERPQDDEADNA